MIVQILQVLFCDEMSKIMCLMMIRKEIPCLFYNDETAGSEAKVQM